MEFPLSRIPFGSFSILYILLLAILKQFHASCVYNSNIFDSFPPLVVMILTLTMIVGDSGERFSPFMQSGGRVDGICTSAYMLFSYERDMHSLFKQCDTKFP